MSDASRVQFEKLKIFQKPQCLIETDRDGYLAIVQETKDDLMKINMPLNVIAITGLYRTGKSYLMNRLAQHRTGFALGSSIQSKTKGIWAWCKIHPTQKNQVLLLLDTEGLGDVEKGDLNHDNKLFVLATLLCSTLVYNMMTAFNQDALEKLTFITEMSSNLKISANDSSDDNFDLLMPEFVLCIRDFTLDLTIDGKKCTEDEYLEHCLKEKKGIAKKYDRTRTKIKKYFTNRKAFTFDIPACRSVMKALDSVRDEDLSKDFIQETVKFSAFIYRRPPKMLQNKKPVTGGMLAELLTAFVNAIKDGKVPCIDDALTAMAKAENEKLAKTAIEKFKRYLGNIKLPVPNKGMLLSKCFKHQTSILTSLNAELVFDDGNRVEISVKEEMEQIYHKLEDENSRQLYKKCRGLLTRMYESEVEGNVKSRKYMVAGGYEMYKRDMERIIEKYNKQLENENVDQMEIQRAKNDFKMQKTPENEEIMAEDKNISQKEAEEEIKRREKEMKQEFDKTQKEEQERYSAELQRQNRRHEGEMEAIRKAQEEKDKANAAAFLEEKLAQRDKAILELSVEVGRLKGIEEERNRKKCPIM